MKNSQLLAILGGSLVIVVIVSAISLFIFFPPMTQETEDNPNRPIVKITNPTNGTTLGDWVTIKYSATAINGTIEEYLLLINEVKVASNTTYYWNTNGLANGMYIISAGAKDSIGQWGFSNHTVTVDENHDSGVVKFLNYNILESGLLPEWKDLVKEQNPDILLLVETGRWTSSNHPDFLDIIDELNDYFPDELPYKGYTTNTTGSTTDGEAIISRYPVIDFTQIPSLNLDDGTTITPHHDVLHAIVQLDNFDVNIIGVHFRCCDDTSAPGKRINDMEGIINYLDTLGNVPIIYSGDFNSFSPNDTGDLAPDPGNLGSDPIAMLLDTSNPKKSNIHNWFDSYRVLNPRDPGYTYVSALFKSRIDFTFVNGFFPTMLVNSTVITTQAAKEGSDHFPLELTLNLDAYTRDLRPPFKVNSLVADVVSPSKVDLSWGMNQENDFSKYYIYRDGIFVDETSNTYYNDSSIVSTTIYSYQVSAVDNNNNEGVKSNQLFINGSFGIITEPGAPEANVTFSQGIKQINLQWNDTTTGGLPITSYKIYRGVKDSNNEWIIYFWGEVTDKTFTDSAIVFNFDYSYWITAINSVGESEYSNQLDANVPSFT